MMMNLIVVYELRNKDTQGELQTWEKNAITATMQEIIMSEGGESVVNFFSTDPCLKSLWAVVHDDVAKDIADALYTYHDTQNISIFITWSNQ